ncbi:RnfABCDGE type electron transport complex subunit G [bacterium]|nr:MAG: RnfABCDGE type electron transport complex subunit G [bacterium]
MKETIRYGFILGIICLVASAVLAAVDSVTEPKIKLQKEEAENKALSEVLPEAASFKPHPGNGRIDYYVARDKSGNIIGFVIKSEGKGYSSNIEVLTGLSRDLEIGEIKILYQNETPGLGSRISESSFRKQFQGRSLDSLDQVQAITGATISSRAVIDSIKAKTGDLKEQLMREADSAR